MKKLTLSPAGLALLQKFEGLRLEAYKDAAGVWTIGYGHTGPDVVEGKKITKEEALDLLRQDVSKYETCVRENVRVPLTQNQFDALVIFAFNVGCAAFENSTLLRLLNQKDYVGAAAEFAKWHKAKGRPLEGLLRRRLEEMRLFLGVK